MALISQPAYGGLFMGLLILLSAVSASPVSSLERLESSDPINVSITPYFVPDVFENTHLSTIGSDGHNTSVPVIGGPECWFCPQENDIDNTKGAWALPGIEDPGIYQPVAIFGFSGPFPVITVSSNGDPSYTPSTTTDEPPSPVKRDSVPTITDDTKSDSFKIFEREVPWWITLPKEGGINVHFNYTESYQDKDVKIPFSDQTISIKWPKHYSLLTGFLSIEETRDEEYDDCGELVKVTLNRNLDWDTTSWELQFRRSDKTIWFTETKASARRYDYGGSTWKWHGRIGETARDNNAWIRGKADEVAAEMNGEKKLLSGGNYTRFTLVRFWVYRQKTPSKARSVSTTSVAEKSFAEPPLISVEISTKA
ncbi:hypothetical protein N7492_009415 [Penicillium capsulatum]|uniref:Uncharacterized protein n=1 Tax=Penicillium capsulatum TaxID=69766 RepID=A0A9W9LI28_9EURO|nr:hypothetical protein N7492_009415 [Penicillium capsulatum]KAJ6106808.1 hypothetical protein N7512_010325 [Penicillium capsulatum]